MNRAKTRLAAWRAACKQGFTLIELLAVIAVVAVLAAILFSAIGMGIEAAHSAKCLSNVRQIGMLHLAYANERNGALICAKDALTGRYWTNQLGATGYIDLPFIQQNPDMDGIFRCPSREISNKPLWMLYEGHMHYGANMYPGFMNNGNTDSHFMHELQRPGNTFLVAEINSDYAIWPSMVRAAYPHKGHINMFFADGSARRLQGPLPALNTPYPTISSKITFPFF